MCKKKKIKNKKQNKTKQRQKQKNKQTNKQKQNKTKNKKQKTKQNKTNKQSGEFLQFIFFLHLLDIKSLLYGTGLLECREGKTVLFVQEE